MIGKFYSFCEVSISIASSCSGTLAKLCSIAMKPWWMRKSYQYLGHDDDCCRMVQVTCMFCLLGSVDW